MSTVLMCPTTLYVRLLVQPMTRKVDRLTNSPSRALTTMAAMAAGVYLQQDRERHSTAQTTQHDQHRYTSTPSRALTMKAAMAAAVYLLQDRTWHSTAQYMGRIR